MVEKKKRWILSVVAILFVGMCFFTEEIRADVLGNAYEFYENYGSEMLFKPESGTEGKIYYATKAKRANTGIQYTTLGWKVTVYNNANYVVDEIYYKLGGSYMVCVDTRTVNGYEYCLYRISLQNMKSRMKSMAQAALGRANAKIIFDACTTTKINGIVQGEMTDEGPSSGIVYETYQGIVNAQNWSSATKETLKTYYNKEVKGLFYSVKLNTSDGITNVYGGGRYCYGTEVSISAEVMDGYHFVKWNGTRIFTEQNENFVLGAKDMDLTAMAEMNRYKIIFDNNGGEGSVPSVTMRYDEQINLPENGILRNGYSLQGWSRNADAQMPEYALGKSISIVSLVKRGMDVESHGASIVFYAVWDRIPEIMGNDIYVSLKDAVKGNVTEEWLANFVSAKDAEDGEILYGINEKNQFWIEDYLATDFTMFRKDGAVTETFCVIDSAGNRTRKRITIHIVDTQIEDADVYLGCPRFISAKYYKDSDGVFVEPSDGGFAENSRWRQNSEYVQLLDSLFP